MPLLLAYLEAFFAERGGAAQATPTHISWATKPNIFPIALELMSSGTLSFLLFTFVHVLFSIEYPGCTLRVMTDIEGPLS
jgi:hypothetical protein